MATITLSPLSRTTFNTQFFLRVAEPVVIDLIFYTSCKLLTVPQKALIASTVAGVVSVILLCSHTKAHFGAAAVIYTAFKVAHYFYIQVSPTRDFEETPDCSKEQWSPAIVSAKMKELKKKTSFTFNGALKGQSSKEIVAEIQSHPDFKAASFKTKLDALWNTPEINRMATDLMRGAAAEMVKLMFALRLETTNPPEMAKLLQTQRFWHRFLPTDSPSFFAIYWYIRCKQYTVNCTQMQRQVVLKFAPTLEEQALFFLEGSDKAKCRELYNKVVDLYQPLLAHLPPCI